MEPTKSITIKVPSLETVTRKRVYPTSLFAVALLFFFFNFCEMSCQGRRFAAVTGVEMITGAQVEAPQQRSMFSFDNPSPENAQKMPGSLWAGLAFVAAAGGLAVFLLKRSKENLIGTIAGATGAISLLLLNITLNSKIREQGGGMIQLSFLMPYWISLLSLSGAGVLCWMRNNQSDAPIPINLETLKDLIKSVGASNQAQPNNPQAPAMQTYVSQPPTTSYAPPTAPAYVPPVQESVSVQPETPAFVAPVQETAPTQPEAPAYITPVQETAPAQPEAPAYVPPVVETVVASPEIPSAQTQPLVSQPLASSAPSQHQHFNIPQQPYQPNYQAPASASNNWLVWVVAGAVGVVVLVTVLVELL